MSKPTVSDIAATFDNIITDIAREHGDAYAVDVFLSAMEMWLGYFLVHNGAPGLWQTVEAQVKKAVRHFVEEQGSGLRQDGAGP